MELHYTLDKKDYRRLVEAVARTKGSASHKVARTFCIFMVIVAGLPYGCVLGARSWQTALRRWRWRWTLFFWRFRWWFLLGWGISWG